MSAGVIAAANWLRCAVVAVAVWMLGEVVVLLRLLLLILLSELLLLPLVIWIFAVEAEVLSELLLSPLVVWVFTVEVEERRTEYRLPLLRIPP